MRQIIIVLLLFVLMGSGTTQTTFLNFDVRLINPDMKVFFLNDFNFTGKSTPRSKIFEIIIRNSPGLDQQQYMLALTILSDRYGELAFGETRPFPLEPGQTIRLTNQNLFTEAQQFSLDNYDIQQPGEELKEKLLATGRIPSGVYTFIFQLRLAEPGGFSTEEVITINATNPSTLDLIAPGDDATAENIPAIFSLYPLFRWESNIERFRLVVAEYDPEIHKNASPQEIIQDLVRLDKLLKVKKRPDAAIENDAVEIIQTTNYQYPLDSSWPLEKGKTYYWQLTGIVESSGFEEELPGEIWAFKIAQVGDKAWNMEKQQIMNALKMLPGEEIEKLFAPGGLLYGYDPNGVIMLDGKPMTFSEFMRLIAKFRSTNYEILDVSVE